MPTRLAFSPVLWVTAFLFWLLYMRLCRTKAHRNLAAFYLSLDEESRRFSAAGEGSLWLAPIPKTFQFRRSGAVTRDQFLYLIGWDDRTERLAYVFQIAIAITLGVILTRIAAIWFDVALDDVGHENEFATLWWTRLSRIVLPILLFFSYWQLASTFFEEESKENNVEPLYPSRRGFVAGLGATFLISIFLDQYLRKASRSAATEDRPSPSSTVNAGRQPLTC